MKYQRYQKYLIVIGISLFAYLIIKTDPQAILDSLKTINFQILLLILPVLVLDGLVKGNKWKLVIRSHGMDYPLKDSIQAFLIGVFFGLVTPGRAGDVVRANFLQQKQKSYSKSLSTVLVDRVIDIGTLAVLGTLSVFLISYLFGRPDIAYILLILLLIGYFTGLAALSSERISMFFLKRIGRQSLIDFYINLRQLDKKKLFFATILGFIAWVITPIEALIIIYSMDLNVTFLFIFLCIPIITLAEIIPVTISGLGTREAAYIALFGLIGISEPVAIAYSLSYLVFTFWGPALVGLFFWIQKAHFNKQNVT